MRLSRLLVSPICSVEQVEVSKNYMVCINHGSVEKNGSFYSGSSKPTISKIHASHFRFHRCDAPIVKLFVRILRPHIRCTFYRRFSAAVGSERACLDHRQFKPGLVSLLITCVWCCRTTCVERFADQPPSASPLPWTVPTGAKNAFIWLCLQGLVTFCF